MVPLTPDPLQAVPLLSVPLQAALQIHDPLQSVPQSFFPLQVVVPQPPFLQLAAPLFSQHPFFLKNAHYFQ